MDSSKKEYDIDSSPRGDLYQDDEFDDVQTYDDKDVFGHEDGNGIQYKTLSWQFVACLMIAEIVSNGMLSLPSGLAVVGIVPGVVVIAFLGLFATYTSVLLIHFKLRHPEVHTMGDAGYIMFGPIGREILAFGTLAFAVFGTGSQLVAGQAALSVLSDNKLCLMLYTGIIAAAILVLSFPRTFDKLSWLSSFAVVSILVAAIVAMVGAGLHPTPNREFSIARSTTFYEAFLAITNPVFAYAGHFMFFSLISEMRQPKQAIYSAYVLQLSATSFYIVFAIITYYYLGSSVSSPSLLSLPTKWSKASFGIALPNFLVAGALYSHLAAKLVFVRIFRGTKHVREHTVLGWAMWTVLIVLMTGAAFVLAIGVPIFNYVVGLAASLFASWYTYGIAGIFFLYDAWYGEVSSWSSFFKAEDVGGMGRGALGTEGWKENKVKSLVALLTILCGAFICVAGLYVIIKGIVLAYDTGEVMKPFAC